MKFALIQMFWMNTYGTIRTSAGLIYHWDLSDFIFSGFYCAKSVLQLKRRWRPQTDAAVFLWSAGDVSAWKRERELLLLPLLQQLLLQDCRQLVPLLSRNLRLRTWSVTRIHFNTGSRGELRVWTHTQAEGINNRICDQVHTDERWTLVWLYLALQDAASLLDRAQLRGGGWHWRIPLARRVPLHWALCCSHGKQSQKSTFISPAKADNTAFLGDHRSIFCLLNIQYPEQIWSSTAQLRPGVAWIRSDEERVPADSFFFRTVWTTSPQLSHDARLSASQVVLVGIIPGV